MKKFNELTQRGQKLRIVRDAIAQIKKGVIEPTSGEYFEFFDTDLYGSSKDLQIILKEAEEPVCQACAKGSLFAACVLNINKVKTDNKRLDYETFQKKKLSKWFSAKELDLIEVAFERMIVIYENFKDDYDILIRKAQKFGKRYRSDKNRLLAILNNILKNGEFKP